MVLTCEDNDLLSKVTSRIEFARSGQLPKMVKVALFSLIDKEVQLTRKIEKQLRGYSLS